MQFILQSASHSHFTLIPRDMWSGFRFKHMTDCFMSPPRGHLKCLEPQAGILRMDVAKWFPERLIQWSQIGLAWGYLFYGGEYSSIVNTVFMRFLWQMSNVKANIVGRALHFKMKLQCETEKSLEQTHYSTLNRDNITISWKVNLAYSIEKYRVTVVN